MSHPSIHCRARLLRRSTSPLVHHNLIQDLLTVFFCFYFIPLNFLLTSFPTAMRLLPTFERVYKEDAFRPYSSTTTYFDFFFFFFKKKKLFTFTFITLTLPSFSFCRLIRTLSFEFCSLSFSLSLFFFFFFLEKPKSQALQEALQSFRCACRSFHYQ